MTVHDILVEKMVYLDMFFIFLGREQRLGPEGQQYLYLTKNMEVKESFRPHSETLFLEKILKFNKGLKLIVSLGFDREEGGAEQ